MLQFKGCYAESQCKFSSTNFNKHLIQFTGENARTIWKIFRNHFVPIAIYCTSIKIKTSIFNIKLILFKNTWKSVCKMGHLILHSECIYKFKFYTTKEIFFKTKIRTNIRVLNIIIINNLLSEICYKIKQFLKI